MKNMGKIKNILLIQTAFLGDIVLTIPLINNIKKLFPDKKLIVLTTPVGKVILEQQKSIDEIIVYDKKGKDRGLKKFFNFVCTLKCFAIDLAIVPHRSIRSAFLVYAAHIPERWGFDNSQGFIFFNKLIKYHKEEHDLDRNLHFLEDFSDGLSKLDRTINFPYDNLLEKTTYDFLQQHNFLDQKIIGIHTGSKWFTKKWPVERFMEVVNLLEDTGYKIIVFGDADDFLMNKFLKYKDSKNIINLIGKTDIKQLISFFRYLSVYLTNDSGPMHIAAAIGVPILAIFGPTTKSLGFFPYNENAKVLEVNLHCRPCGKHGGDSCPMGHFKCMRDITADMVVMEIEKILVENK